MIVFSIIVSAAYCKEVSFNGNLESYTAGDKIVFGYSGEYDKESEIVIEKRPFLSEAEGILRDGKVIIDADTVGKYEFKILSSGEVARYSFTAEGDTEDRADDLFKILKTKNGAGEFQGVIESMNILKRNYPESRYFPDALYLAADSAEKNGENKITIKYLKKIVDNFKMSEEANEMVMERLFKAFDKAQDKESARIYGKKLYELNEEKYAKEYGSFCVKYDIYESEGMTVLEEYYSKTLDKECAEIIGDYYLKNNPEKAVVFYKNDNNKKLSLAYLKLKDYNKFQAVSSNLNGEDRKEVSKIVEEQKRKELLESYFEKVKDGNKQKKYQISELYANKILVEAKNGQQKREALFELGEISYLKRDFKKTISYLKKYEKDYGIVKEADIYYYLALSYYNLNDMKNSSFYFDKITKEFPFTSWDSKSKIYKMKLGR